MPQTPSTFIPDDNPLPSSFIPDAQQLVPPQSSLLSKIGDTLMTPLLPEVENTTHNKFDFPNSKLFQSIWPGGLEIPNFRDVYNEILRPATAPIGLAAIATEGAISGLGRNKSIPKESISEPRINEPVQEPIISRPKLKISASEAAANLKQSGSMMPKSFIADETPIIEKPISAGKQLEKDLTQLPTLDPDQKFVEGTKKLGFEFDPVNKRWIRTNEKPANSIADELIKSEEGALKPGAFDPKQITAKIQDALSKAAEGPNKYAPYPEIQGPVGKLLAAVQDAKENTVLQAELNRATRSQRITEAEKITGGGKQGFFARLGQLKGEFEKIPNNPPLKLDETDVNSLFDAIDKSPNLRPYEKISAQSGLVKLLGEHAEGLNPQPGELAKLDRVFGSGFSSQIQHLYGGLIPPVKLTNELVNIPKMLRASMDLSAPLRQGIGLIHRNEYWDAFGEMIKNVGSKEHYDATMDSIASKPLFQPQLVKNASGKIEELPSFAELSGLKTTNLMDYNEREEAFASKLAEKIPGVQRSERAYLAFLNKLRADTFENMINDAEKAGLNPKQNLVLSKQIADYINNATGRGSLGKFEKNAVELNNLLFSPRLIMSRIQMLNPNNYIRTDPFVRKQYLKSMLAISTLGATTLGLGKLAGGELDQSPTSADFGKVKFGNTRLDPWGGFQQYIVLFNRLRNGETTSSTTGKTTELGSHFGAPTRFDMLSNFAANKLNPTVRFAYDWLSQTKNRPFNINQETENLFVPMIIQDLNDIARDDPKLLPLMVPSTFGMGVQTYNNHPLFSGSDASIRKLFSQ